MPRLTDPVAVQPDDDDDDSPRMGPLELAAHYMCLKLGTPDAHKHREEYLQRINGTFVPPEPPLHNPHHDPRPKKLTSEQRDKIFRLWAGGFPLQVIMKTVNIPFYRLNRAIKKMEVEYPEISEARSARARDGALIESVE